MTIEFYLGIDLHLKNSYLVLMDREGGVLDERQLPNGEVKSYLEAHIPEETFAVLEATRNWAFMYDCLSEHVERVELAHSKELKAISNAAVKTDRIDAHTLAHLARLNFLPIAYAASTEVRDLRLQMRHRQTLIKHRTQTKNRIHAVLASYNLVSPVADLFGVQGREWLAQQLEVVRLAAKQAITVDLALIDELNTLVEMIESQIKLTPQQKHDHQLLMTLPGVGKVVATIMVAEIGDIRRFDSPKALCNWAGLTPKVRNSGDIVRRGRISKEGPSLLRAAMGQAATIAARRSKRWQLVHEHLSKRCGKKGAKVAVARRLLTVAYHILMRDQPYREDYQHQQIVADQGA